MKQRPGNGPGNQVLEWSDEQGAAHGCHPLQDRKHQCTATKGRLLSYPNTFLALLYFGEMRMVEGGYLSQCFAVAVATVVSLAAGAHASYSQHQCEPATCMQIFYSLLGKKAPCLPPCQQQLETRLCCRSSSSGKGEVC